ncbi:hypothetical protein GCM10009733_098790 [Nonomuraea maheshkhaliensis]|uniref:Uncharacterized protein n=1 Tax=Nonomuraea maheshkhaliensis TaxID=419590 RepID=A0ABP4TDF4_9ACTN
MARRDYYRDLSETELRGREDFVIEGGYLRRGRLRGRETRENVALSTSEVEEAMGPRTGRSTCGCSGRCLFSGVGGGEPAAVAGVGGYRCAGDVTGQSATGWSSQIPTSAGPRAPWSSTATTTPASSRSSSAKPRNRRKTMSSA